MCIFLGFFGIFHFIIRQIPTFLQSTMLILENSNYILFTMLTFDCKAVIVIKQKFLNRSMSLINKYTTYSEDDIEKLKYGLEGLYLTITKTVIILLISLILNIFKETLLVIVIFNIIRYFGFGFHAEKSYQCLIFSTFNFVVIPLIYLSINLSDLALVIICSLCIISFLLYAPADTVKRPLPNKKKRLIRKSLTVLVSIVYISLIFIFNNHYLTSLLISALTIQAIVINPLTYKLFGQPYRNYKNYTVA